MRCEKKFESHCSEGGSKKSSIEAFYSEHPQLRSRYQHIFDLEKQGRSERDCYVRCRQRSESDYEGVLDIIPNAPVAQKVRLLKRLRTLWMSRLHRLHSKNNRP